MAAEAAPADLVDARWAYEPKYDGMRAEVAVGPTTVRVWSRDGNDKTAQFPDVVAALEPLARRARSTAILDGELVALAPDGDSLGFPPLSQRISLTKARDIEMARRRQPAGFIAFDVLRIGDEDLRQLPLRERRARLEQLMDRHARPGLRLSEFTVGDGRALHARARSHPAWEGVIAKRLDSLYASGRRSGSWRKVKLRMTQSCVVGGWTQHRGSRSRSLLLGVYDAGQLRYIGHAGVTPRRETDPLWQRLHALETDRSAFADPPTDTRTPPHWVRPEVVVEIQHDGWVNGKLRHPATFLGMREDVYRRTVHREDAGTEGAARVSMWAPEPSTGTRPARLPADLARLVADLESIETRGGTGVLTFPDGFRLTVSHLDQIVWPTLRITKGALLRYYVRIAPLILPALADRPLGAKYFPHGLRGRGFFQQRAPAQVPDGVRVEMLDIDIPVRRRLVGGPLLTALFMVDAGVISHDPWFSRVGSLDTPDYCVFDLDPMRGASFAQVVDVARAIHDALDRLGIDSVPKLSGASGLHVYVPLAPGTTYTESRTICETVATFVVKRHHRIATVERSIALRGAKVYVDCLQNLRSKTLAAAYSARANAFAGVSAPLSWSEVAAGLEPRDFTLLTIDDRVRRVGDLWWPMRSARGVDPRAITPGTVLKKSA